MGKCCTSNQILKNQRRINGLQLPLNLQQIICWIVLVVTAVINCSIVSQIQFKELEIISLIIFIILYISHIVSHVAALAIDPAEKDLRDRETSEVPEFDRNLHAHVIENGRCHLCNIYTSNKKTKHCGLCNKCVCEFDHHCKWLNNCIGGRNYSAFIGCVTTALFISTFTSALCIADITLFLKYPQLLSSDAQKFFNCNSGNSTTYVIYCQSSITFLTFLVVLCVSGIAMACTLLHLCCFHIYIYFLGVSTYEYITKNNNTEKTQATCCSMNFKRKMYEFNRKKDTSDFTTESGKTHVTKNEANVANLVNILIDTELNRATKLFSPDKNRVHPQRDGDIS
ncbi:palmitoyltransferase ZDHHC11 [Epargyreus clarus]|uniref:palmitoyltransferase ZDHHC11 n=1 Tax=Epargyreus clarus TaxID=520877 RepID=UPI003C2B388E